MLHEEAFSAVAAGVCCFAIVMTNVSCLHNFVCLYKYCVISVYFTVTVTYISVVFRD